MNKSWKQSKDTERFVLQNNFTIVGSKTAELKSNLVFPVHTVLGRQHCKKSNVMSYRKCNETIQKTRILSPTGAVAKDNTANTGKKYPGVCILVGRQYSKHSNVVSHVVGAEVGIANFF
jgi:hypothetical protein